MARALINVPKTVKKGEAFEIKVLISHPMESGQRRDATGQPIPRHIINRFTCTYGGETVLDVELQPATAANPFLSFQAVAVESGTIEFVWVEDGGATHRERATIAVA
jgi:sulfur-oxidizing protein SoxZ